MTGIPLLLQSCRQTYTYVSYDHHTWYFREWISWSPTNSFGRLYMGSKWYTSDFCTFVSDIETFIPSWHQGFYSVLKEHNFKCLQLKSVSLRHVDVCKIVCQSGVCQWVLRNGSYWTTYIPPELWLVTKLRLEITNHLLYKFDPVPSSFRICGPLKKHLADN
jgi:hypothetical protein